MRGARIDEPRFLAPGNHLDRKTQCALRLTEEIARVLRDAQRIGRDRAHMIGMEIAQALAETLERLPAAQLRGPVEKLVARESSGKAHGLAQRIDGVDLATARALFDTPHDQPETIGTEIDRSQEFRVLNHASK